MEFLMILTLVLNTLWVTWLWKDQRQDRKELHTLLKNINWKLEMLERRVDTSVQEITDTMK